MEKIEAFGNKVFTGGNGLHIFTEYIGDEYKALRLDETGGKFASVSGHFLFTFLNRLIVNRVQFAWVEGYCWRPDIHLGKIE